MFFSVIIGIFSLGQAIPNLEKLITAAGASITIYSIIDQVCICSLQLVKGIYTTRKGLCLMYSRLCTCIAGTRCIIILSKGYMLHAIGKGLHFIQLAVYIALNTAGKGYVFHATGKWFHLIAGKGSCM